MDTKLNLKPIELIDIGIDKHTKIPMPILTDNLIYTNENDNGIPLNTIVLKLKSNVFNLLLDCEKSIILKINFGDTGITSTISGETININYNYPSTIEKTITITGDLDKIVSFTCVGDVVGLSEVNIKILKKLKYLNLSGNTLTEIDLSGMFNLNYINLSNNKLNSSSVDDIFIQSNTFLSYNGFIDVSNNESPSIYSLNQRNNLQKIKHWTLNI